MKLRQIIRYLIKEHLNEVRYINTKEVDKEESLKDSETIRVYHGFRDFEDVKKVLTKGLSGKQKVERVYSYEEGNNPYGLFVTVDFNRAKYFARSGVIIEFSTKVSDLESPIWVSGRSYYVQGEYTKSFKKDSDEREQQRLINRQKAGESPYDYISKSDRPELADVIFRNYERQALYNGDLNPNMIKAVWYNEDIKLNGVSGDWVRMDRNDFIKKLNIDTKNDSFIKYLPNEDFDFDEFVQKYLKGDYNNSSLSRFLNFDENKLKNLGFFPKQIKKIIQMRQNGEFDKYFN